MKLIINQKQIYNQENYFLPEYLKEHNLEGNEYSVGYLPLLLAFNKNSNSTPIRLVITPNWNGPAKERSMSNITSDGFQYEDNNGNDHVIHSFSYNDKIRDYAVNS